MPLENGARLCSTPLLVATSLMYRSRSPFVGLVMTSEPTVAPRMALSVNQAAGLVALKVLVRGP